ncbi:MAG: hypothetical protein ACFFA6_12155 [Promethearchaeota archaeon]
MDRKEEETDIQKLSLMLSKIQNLYYKKKEQLEELQIEISELREILSYLNSLISNKSFHSADEIYAKALAKSGEELETDDYFIEEIPKEKVQGTNIKRKIFSKEGTKETKLLCVLNFYNLNEVEIKFIEPKTRYIRESSEDFVRIFLKEALIKIKESNPSLSVSYSFLKDSDIIESMNISNLNSIKEYDLITSKIRELLATEISSEK